MQEADTLSIPEVICMTDAEVLKYDKRNIAKLLHDAIQESSKARVDLKKAEDKEEAIRRLNQRWRVITTRQRNERRKEVSDLLDQMIYR